MTFCQILDTDVVELLDLLHDQLLLVDLDDHGSVSCIAPGKSKLAQSCLEFLWYVDSMRLRHFQSKDTVYL